MGRLSKYLAALLVVLAIVLGGYAWMLSHKSTRVPPPTASTAPMAISQRDAAESSHPVVVAARNLPAGHPLTADDLAVKALPQRPTDGYAGVQALIGQVALVPIQADAPLTRGALATSVASQLLAGERAMAVAVDELNGVGHRIIPGDRVDVFVSLKPERSIGGDDNKAYEGQSRLIVSSLRVLGYGAASLGDPVDHGDSGDAGSDEADTSRSRRTSSSGSAATDSTKPRRAASSAVLAVPVEQINVLAQAAQGGRLLLVLRNPIDSQVADASLFPKPASVLAIRADLDDAQKAALADPVNVAYAGLDAPNLGGSIASPKPPRATTRTQAAPRRTLEVIRGDQRSQATY